MSIHINNSASSRALLWGIALIIPAPLLMLVTAASPYLRYQVFFLVNPVWNTIGFVAQVILPIAALVINLAALLQRAHTDSVSFATLRGVKRYRWTIALVFVTFAWLVMIFAPLALQQ